MTGQVAGPMLLDLQKAPLPAVFAYGFRPFFLSAGCYAVIAIGCWLAVYAAGARPRFVADFSLEGAGFEPSVPRLR